ncbi:MAG TPA: hypothetical protein VG223_14050 [Solirubrobacteraceae bacterium]|jgi:hypothetical protein|nr:hypothetical protein [Solirubrobacteraceae bacterium]
MDLELLTASLRADSSDIRAFVEGLAVKLEEALPGRARVDRAKQGFRGPKVVRAISVDAGSQRLELRVSDRGGLETRNSRVSGGIVLKTEPVEIDAWLAALGQALAVEAGRSEQTRQALERLLLG